MVKKKIKSGSKQTHQIHSDFLDDLESFTSPESSNIAGGEYDGETGVLTINFGKEGVVKSTYTYQNFPRHLWEKFKAASSKGSFFAAEIRNVYPGVKQ